MQTLKFLCAVRTERDPPECVFIEEFAILRFHLRSCGVKTRDEITCKLFLCKLSKNHGNGGKFDFNKVVFCVRSLTQKTAITLICENPPTPTFAKAGAALGPPHVWNLSFLVSNASMLRGSFDQLAVCLRSPLLLGRCTPNPARKSLAATS